MYGDCALTYHPDAYMETLSFSTSSSIASSPITSAIAITGQPDRQKPQQYSSLRASRATVNCKSAGIPKPKQSKSRNGCSTCKAKRLKCDEAKPGCEQCLKRKVICGGYKKDFKWRAFGDASPQTWSSTGSERSFSQERTTPGVTNLYSFDRVSPPSFAVTTPNTPQAYHTTIRQPSGLNRELTFPTPEQLLQQPRDIARIKHESFGGAIPDLAYPEDGKHKNMPGVNTDHFIPRPPFEQMNLRHPIYNANRKIKEEEIEEIPRQDIISEAPALIHTSSSSESSGLDLFFAFNRPRLAANSPEMLALNFDRNTCGILSVKDGMSENPWRTLIWPMAQDSPALYHAIASLSAFHCSVSNYQMKVAGMKHMSQSISHLCQDINIMSIEQSLATSVALALADAWDTSISTGKEHVRGGGVLISNALLKMKNERSRMNTSTLRYLCKTWLYMDVLSRLTSTEIDDSDVDCPLWSQIDLLTNSDEIDPLLGCASTLFPIIGRVANLVSQVRKTRQNSISLISKANELKQELLNWSPPAYLQKPEDPTCEIQHSIQTAEAYQWATLLHLHQAVPEIPSKSAESLAQKVLLRLATVPVQSRTLIIQIYPLLAASCEVSSADDRAWVLQRWMEMHRRMQISNIDRCIEVVKEVWNRRDQAQMQNQQKGQHQTAYNQGLSDAEPFHMVSSLVRPQLSREASYEVLQGLPFERSVRGSQHWCGVMEELKWEVMLG